MLVRVAIYLRQSQDITGQGLGVDRQRDDCRRLLNARGWTDAVEFVDNDVSASKSKPRPQFTEMMRRVDAGDFDIIVARHMDRLLRKLSDFVRIQERCKATGTYIMTAADGIDTSTDGGRMVAGILATIAEGEMERKSARQRSANAQAANQGRWRGGPRPYGYESDGMTIRPDEAAVIAKGYLDVLAGESLSAITRDWNSKGVTPRGKAWTRQAVRQVLGNPRNAGQRRHRQHNDRGAKNPHLGIVGDAAWPAIVDVTTWSAAVRILYNPMKQRVNGARALLSGVAVCGVCGDYTGRGTIRNGAPTYRCRSNAHFSCKADPVDRHVEQLVLERLTQPDAALLWTAEQPNAAALMSEASMLREELSALDQDRVDGRLDRGRWRSMNDRVMTRLGEIDMRIARAGESSPLAIVASADVRATWKGLSVDRRRVIIFTLMTPVIHPAGQGARKFRPETVEPRWFK